MEEMIEERPTAAACPEHLKNEVIPLLFAARISGRKHGALYRAAHLGLLPAVWFPAGKQKHWQVKVGDLVDYTGRPLTPEGLRELEERLAGRTGRRAA
jgi:hypothetical protein